MFLAKRIPDPNWNKMGWVTAEKYYLEVWFIIAANHKKMPCMTILESGTKFYSVELGLELVYYLILT